MSVYRIDQVEVDTEVLSTIVNALTAQGVISGTPNLDEAEYEQMSGFAVNVQLADGRLVTIMIEVD